MELIQYQIRKDIKLIIQDDVKVTKLLIIRKSDIL